MTDRSTGEDAIDGATGASTPSRSEIEDILRGKLPPVDCHGEIVEEASPSRVRIRLPFQPTFMGGDVWKDSQDRVFSGPKVMGLADTAMYACMHAALGLSVVAVMTSINVTFLRPAASADLIAGANLIRLGKRLAFLEVTIFSQGKPEPVAHATATFAYRLRAAGG
jgi:uncharacterized protein (TIGR00369 family)